MKKTHLILIAILLVFTKCKNKLGPEDCFMAYGSESSIIISPGDFFEMEIGDRFVIDLKQDTSKFTSVTIKGGSNVIKNVSIGVNNGKLTIKDRNVCNWARDFSKKIKLEITCRKINGITITDACEIATSDTLLSDSLVIFQRSTGRLNLSVNIDGGLDVNHEGLGEIHLYGYAAIFVPVMFDAGKLFAQNLQGDYTFSYHYGINELHVKPFKALFAFVGNKGATYYYQDPIETPLKVTRLGEGKVEKR